MRKYLIYLSCIFLLICNIQTALATNYYPDDDAIETALSARTVTAELSLSDARQIASVFTVNTIASAPAAEKNQYLAGIMAIGINLLGIPFIPVHRLYLGTSTGTTIGYVCTCGGCGLLNLIDGIVLFVTDSPEEYVDNPNFFMW